MPGWQKLVTGFAALGLLAKAAWFFEGQGLVATLGTGVAAVMAANGVADGAARWSSDAGWTSRNARLSGSADAATRARIVAQVRALPGVHDAVWIDRR